MCRENEKTAACELCGSTDDYLNFHHLIPRTVHSNRKFEKLFTKDEMKNRGIWICKLFCHKQIHRLYSEKILGEFYNTLEKMISSPDVSRYIKWRRKRIEKI